MMPTVSCATLCAGCQSRRSESEDGRRFQSRAVSAGGKLGARLRGSFQWRVGGSLDVSLAWLPELGRPGDRQEALGCQSCHRLWADEHGSQSRPSALCGQLTLMRAFRNACKARDPALSRFRATSDCSSLLLLGSLDLKGSVCSASCALQGWTFLMIPALGAERGGTSARASLQAVKPAGTSELTCSVTYALEYVGSLMHREPATAKTKEQMFRNVPEQLSEEQQHRGTSLVCCRLAHGSVFQRTAPRTCLKSGI